VPGSPGWRPANRRPKRTAAAHALATRAESGANDSVYRIIVALMRTLRVKVKPGSREEDLTLLADGSWLARVKAPPVDGKANHALITLIAAHFGVRKAQVNIKSGAGGRMKLVQLED
jgi:uncharacterized protein (TIGR00251 family)